MNIGMRNYYINKYGLSDGACRMAEHGYTHLDFQMVNTDTEYYSMSEGELDVEIRQMRAILEQNGITVHQIHGPWRAPRDSTDEDRRERFEKMSRALLIAKLFGAEYMAIHPLMPFGGDSPDNPDELYEINKRFFTDLSSVASELGVVVCLENMPFRNFPLSPSKRIYELIKDVGMSSLKMCLDVGHAHILGESLWDTVHLIADELRILHVHDNDGENDIHLPPYDGNADIKSFGEALHDIGFNGVLMLETSPRYLVEEDALAAELRLAKITREIAGL